MSKIAETINRQSAAEPPRSRQRGFQHSAGPFNAVQHELPEQNSNYFLVSQMNQTQTLYSGRRNNVSLADELLIHI